jgi:hypothetical protein
MIHGTSLKIILIARVALHGEKLTMNKKQYLHAMRNLLIKIEIISYIFEMDDPKEVWEKLENLFVTSTLV